MSDRSTTYLKDRHTGQMVEAILIDGVSLEEVDRAESSWRRVLEQKLAELERSGRPEDQWPEHSHWDWRKKREAIEGVIDYRMFGVECEGEVQGLMVVSTARHRCRISEQKGPPRRCSCPASSPVHQRAPWRRQGDPYRHEPEEIR